MTDRTILLNLATRLRRGGDAMLADVVLRAARRLALLEPPDPPHGWEPARNPAGIVHASGAYVEATLDGYTAIRPDGSGASHDTREEATAWALGGA